MIILALLGFEVLDDPSTLLADDFWLHPCDCIPPRWGSDSPVSGVLTFFYKHGGALVKKGCNAGWTHVMEFTKRYCKGLRMTIVGSD